MHRHGASSTKMTTQAEEVSRIAWFVDANRYHAWGREVPKGRVKGRFYTSNTDHPPIVYEMAQLLYDRFYTKPLAIGPPAMTDHALRIDFTAEISRAHATGVHSRSAGWRIADKQKARLILEGPDYERAIVRPEEFEAGRDGTGVALLPREYPERQSGFYHLLGATDHAPLAPGGTLRVYFATVVQGAIPLVRTLTTELNDAGIPYRFKIISDPQAYKRADAGVLYLPMASWNAARGPILRTWSVVHPWLKDDVPAFTKRLASGLGVAEDPGPNESFGQNRCRLAAEGLWNAHLEGARSSSKRYDAICARFREFGVDPARPYLQGGSHDRY